MKMIPLAATMILCISVNNAGYAAVSTAQGTVRFEGRIVERGCSDATEESSRLVLSNCPVPGATPTLNVHGIDPINAGATVTLKRIADSGAGQQFEIVDRSGTPVRSGNYLITVTLP